METIKIINGCSDTVRSYRTYEEWKLTTLSVDNSVLIVLTVPMRNGNDFAKTVNGKTLSCSYRTYEEWKPWIRWIY